MEPVDRIQMLVEANLALLEQGQRLVEGLAPAIYSRRIEALFANRVGAQVRHVLEFYECFLSGAPASYIDYDARRRDVEVELSPLAAVRVLERIAREFRTREWADEYLRVRMENAPPGSTIAASLGSSVGRELQALISHTVHHYALIAIALRLLDVPVEAEFGVAPSTLRYQRTLAEVA